MGGVLVGTSGWVYSDWAGRLYRDVPRSRWLQRYAEVFATVEVNATFYRLPTVRAVSSWRTQVPPHFRFVVKGSRYLTHMKRLTDRGDGVRRFFERLEPLGECLDTVLWQLPPNMHVDAERLDAFLAALPTSTRHAVEFRHVSWQRADVYELLDRRGVLTVAVSGPQLPEDHTVTGGAAYVRFHGLRPGYAYDYTDGDLRPWAKWLRMQSDGHAFFNNDGRGHAVKNAIRFRELLET
jgi:uncharacterized protein YecE (DUF72 family)